jgi:hypothetical protein
MSCPYTFPHETRAEMVAYLTDRRPRAYDWQRYLFCWNVKVHSARFDGDSLRARAPEYALDPAHDDAWTRYIESDDSLFYHLCEDAGRYLEAGEWCSYPGDDQGDWAFRFAGRSGGWLVLEEWRGRHMHDFDPEEMLDSEEWSDDDLTAFYRGIRCADSDFGPDKAAAEVEYQAAFRRDEWEAERRAEAEAAAARMAERMAEARPDLSPCY